MSANVDQTLIQDAETGAKGQVPGSDALIQDAETGSKNQEHSLRELRGMVSMGLFHSRTSAERALRHPVTEALICFLIFLDIGLASIYSMQDNPGRANWTWVLRWFTLAATVAELVARFWIEGGRRFYVNSLNLIETATVVVCFAALIFPEAVPWMGSLRILRILWILVESCGFELIRRVGMCLFYNPAFVGILAMYFFCFLVTFAIGGVELYANSLRTRCTYMGLETMPQSWCPSTDDDKGWDCATGHTCNREYGNPLNGQLSFDNFGRAFLMVMVIQSSSDWWYTDALIESEYAPSLFYSVAIIVMVSFFVVNLFVACICHGYSQLVLEDDLQGDQEAATGEDDEEAPVEEEVPAWKTQLRVWLKSPCFQTALSILILINMAQLASMSREMDSVHEEIAEVAEIIFCCLFMLETIVKIIAFGREYFQSGWDLFDGTISTAAFILMIVEISLSAEVFAGIVVLRPLRLFRVLRATRVLRRVKSVHDTLVGMLDAAPAMGAVLLILFALFWMFAVIGHDLYGDKFPEGERSTFDSIFDSVLCLARVLTADGWEQLMATSMNTSSGWAAPAYFLIFYVISNYIVLNLVIAAVLSGVRRLLEVEEPISPYSPEGDDPVSEDKRGPESLTGWTVSEKTDQEPLPEKSDLWMAESALVDEEGSQGVSQAATDRPFRTWCRNLDSSCGFYVFMLCNVILSNVVVFFDTPNNSSGPFQYSAVRQIEDILTIYFVLIFTGEALVKIIGNGLWSENSAKVAPVTDVAESVEAPTPAGRCRTSYHGPYLKHRPNLFSLAVLLLSYYDLAVCGSDTANTSCASWRLGRAARAFRLVAYSSGIEQCFDALMFAVPNLFAVVFVSNAIYFCFAIVAVNMFGSELRWCNDDTVSSKAECVGLYTNDQDLTVPRDWVSWWRNFDHVGNAYYTLFEIGSLDAWSEVMYRTMDIVGFDKQPQKNASWGNAIFFLIFIFFGSLLILQMFVSVVIDMYTKENEELQGSQKDFENLQQMIQFLSPDPMPKRPRNNRFRKLCYDICVPWDRTVGQQKIGASAGDTPSVPPSKYSHLRMIRTHFDKFIMVVVCCNMILLCTIHANMSHAWTTVLDVMDAIFVAIYCFEIVVRSGAVGIKKYFRSYWNSVDAVIVFMSVLAGFAGGKATKLFRVLRIVRLLKTVRYFNMITSVMIQSLVQIWHVLSTLGLVMFAWAAFGVEVFGTVRYGSVLDRHTNFENFPNAIYALTRVLFGEWVYIRRDCRIQPPLCTADEDCGSWVATPFFFLYLTINSFILVNMCVAVVLTNFAWIYATEKVIDKYGEITVTSEGLQRAREAWDKYDKRGAGFIMHSDLRQFLIDVGPPIGLEEVDKLGLAPILVQLSSFPLAKPGYCRFQDVIAVRMARRMGSEAVADDQVLAVLSTRPALLRLRSAIHLVIQQNRLASWRLFRQASKQDSIGIAECKMQKEQLTIPTGPRRNSDVVALPPPHDPTVEMTEVADTEGLE